MGACFLFSAAVFPRLTLLAAWCVSAMPANPTPLWLDALCAIFVPRALIAWWLYEAGAHPLLVGLFVLLEVMAKLSGGSASRRRGGE